MTSIRHFIESWRDRFKEAGIDDARLNAELLLAHALGVGRNDVALRLDESLSDVTLKAANALCERRLKHEPVDYIIGRREFFGREFHVEPGVLIPRPETELIIELVRKLQPDLAGRAADVGSGSGALAVTLAVEFPALQVLATDLHPTPLKVTRGNAERHGVASRVFCARMDGLSAGASGFDLVVSNPPYVTPEEYTDLQAEVRDHEPKEALVGGPDGLAVALRVLTQVAERLKPGGYLLMEHGMQQGNALREAALTAGFAEVRTERDYAGRDRILVARA